MSLSPPVLVKEKQSSQAKVGFDFATVRQPKRSVLGILGRIAALTTLVIGLIPFVFICWLIVSTGANNICVDYAAFVHVVDKVLTGQYHWLSIFSDSFIRTHMVLFPVLVHTAIAYTTHWDVTSELYVGMAFHAMRAVLLADLIAGRSSDKWHRCAVMGVVASLVFAMSQTCIMIYGEASIAIGLCLLGFTFALWSLCKYGRTPRGLMLMSAGGILSCYSFGNVVPCWTTLFLAIFLLPARGWTHHWNSKKLRKNGDSDGEPSDIGFFVNRKVAFGYWLLGTVVSLLPYYVFLSQRSIANPELTKTFGLFEPSFLIQALGRPFAKNMGMVYGQLSGADTATWILLGMVVALTVLSLVYKLRINRVTKTCVLLFAYGLVSIWSVGVFRTHIAPWYASMAMYCWLAVVGVCASNMTRAFNDDFGAVGSSSFGYKARLILGFSGALGLGTVVVLYLLTNLSYRDKQFFLTARAPVSAEYLRSYETAPTFLESSIFSNDGRPDRILSFANSLAKNDLCVFAPRQTHALQGQFALANVSIESVPGSKRVIWLEGQNTRRRTSWRDYHHLNLAVPDGNIVDWKFAVPGDAKEAVFETAVTSFSDPAGGCVKKTAKVVSTVSVVSTTTPYSLNHSDENSARVASSGSASYVTMCDDNWKPVRLNLLPYRGKSITLRLASQSQGNLYNGYCDDRDCIPSSVLYKYPRINLTVGEDKPAVEIQKIRPSNTDLSADFPRNYVHQLELPAFDSKSWKSVALGLPEDKSAELQAKSWILPEQKRLDIGDFDYIVVQAQPLPGKTWCSIKLHMQFDDGTTDGFSIPLMPDQEIHRYSYPSRLLTPKSGAKLVSMLVYASAVDDKKAKEARIHDEKESESALDEGEPRGSNLCNCVQVKSIACVRTFSNQ